MSVKMNLTMNVEGYKVAQDTRKWHYRVVYVDYMFEFAVVGTCDANMDKYQFVGEWFFADHDEAQDVADGMNRVGKDRFFQD